PPGNTQCRARHHVVDVSAALWCERNRVRNTNRGAEEDGQKSMAEREHQSGGADSACGHTGHYSAKSATHLFFRGMHRPGAPNTAHCQILPTTKPFDSNEGYYDTVFLEE